MSTMPHAMTRSTTGPISIPPSSPNGYARQPSTSFGSVTYSPPGQYGSLSGVRAPKVLSPFATGELRLLLLENINQAAVQAFKDEGFQVDFHTRSFSEEELVQKIGNYHAIGIRSKTKITERVLKAAPKVRFLVLIGCKHVSFHPSSSSSAASASASTKST